MSNAVAVPRIELRGLGKRYHEAGGEREVLAGIDVTILPGQVVALLGRSGSGKSTLLNLIGGLDEPSEGEVFLDGCLYHRLRERERTLYRRYHIGFVFQLFNLIPTLTVSENLELPLELIGVGRHEASSRAARLLHEVNLSDRGGSFPDRLSGGEQQRVAIARALATEPMLVLADEPTGNLDAETGRSVLDLFDRMLRSRKDSTMIVATHSRAVASRADRVLILRDRRLIEGPDPSATETFVLRR